MQKKGSLMTSKPQKANHRIVGGNPGENVPGFNKFYEKQNFRRYPQPGRSYEILSHCLRMNK